LLVNLADSKRQSPGGGAVAALPFDCLEQFHVFVLANILQRPIIIVGEAYLRSMTGDSIEPNDFVGIYLPLMWSCAVCLPAPIVLAFLMDHFLPLTCRSHNASESSASKVHAVPLVTAAMEPLRVHFLLPTEENSAHLLLQQYLQLTEVKSAADSTGCDAVLAARILLDSRHDTSQPITLRRMFERHSLLPKCTMKNCDCPRNGMVAGLCFICSFGYPPYQSLVSDSLLRRCIDVQTLPRCANVGCCNQSWMPYGGLCRLCAIGFYPRHYDMPISAIIDEKTTERYTNHGMYC